MRAVIQRVSEASVVVDGGDPRCIGEGYVVLLGVGAADDEASCDKLWGKVSRLRICADENGKTNLSIADTGGDMLIVSQFTLYANCRRGNRPSFTDAGAPDMAIPLYERFVAHAREQVAHVETGEFGADMQVSLVNDGPFTIVLDTDEL